MWNVAATEWSWSGSIRATVRGVSCPTPCSHSARATLNMSIGRGTSATDAGPTVVLTSLSSVGPRIDHPVATRILIFLSANATRLAAVGTAARGCFSQPRVELIVVVAGYGDDGPAYLCPEKAYVEGGYEPSASNVKPESEALLKKAIAALLGVD